MRLGKRLALFGVLAATACAPDGVAETTSRNSLPILAGRPSSEDENAAVYIETEGEEATLRCSGRIIAPGLVLTVRHCVIKRKSEDVFCNPDGSPKDISDTVDVRAEPAERIKVFVGSHKSALRELTVREVVTTLEVSVCRSDIAFLVLDEPGLDARAPLRRESVKIGEALTISGWGFTSDARDALPETRSTLDHLRVTEVGPGVIPAGTFATAGNSLCYGDSGAVALIDNAVVGAYSRIEGPCSLEAARNILTAVATQTDLVKRAYAAIGEEPWYAGERPPWLTPAGGACTTNDTCRSAVCDAETSTCASPCGAPTAVACGEGQTCDEATQSCVAAPEPKAADSSCSAAPTTAGPRAMTLAVVGALLAGAFRRVRRKHDQMDR